jgi:uncharacterized glyoxalase superfamily metalloenzyme YdcJ
MANTITADDIREHFSQAMSAMYQQEVPQYGTLLELVADVNLAVLENNPLLHEQLANSDELARLNVERHGAIRVGTALELSTLRRMFAIMGMYPVSYYDLSQAGFPSTRRRSGRWRMQHFAVIHFVFSHRCYVLS